MALNLLHVEATPHELHSGPTSEDVWTDIAGLSMAGSNFTANNDYLIYVECDFETNFQFTAGDEPGQFLRLVDGNGKLWVPHIAHHYTSASVNSMGHQYRFMFKMSEASPTDLIVQHKTDGVVTGNKTYLWVGKIWAIDLDALGTEGTDWIYAENRTVQDDSDTVKASVTFTPSAEEWVFLGYGIGGAQTATLGNHKLNMTKDAVLVHSLAPQRRIHSSYLAARYQYDVFSIWTETLAASSQTWGIGMSQTSTGKEFFSSIFGFRTSALLNSQVAYDASYFQNPANVWEDEAGVTLTHTTDAGADGALLFGWMLNDRNTSIINIDDGAGTTRLDVAPADTYSDTYGAFQSLSADAASAGYHGLGVTGRTGALSAATVRMRRRSGNAFDTTGEDSVLLVLDADSITAATAGGSGVPTFVGRDVIQSFAASSIMNAATTWTNLGELNAASGLTASEKHIVMIAYDQAELASGNSKTNNIRVLIDGVDVWHHASFTGGAGNTYDNPFFYVGVHTFGATPTVTLQGYTTDAVNLEVHNLSMLAINIDDLTAGVDYFYDEDATVHTASASSRWSFDDTGAQVALTSKSSVDYLAMYCAKGFVSTIYREWNFGVSQDGATGLEVEGRSAIMPIFTGVDMSAGGMAHFHGTGVAGTFEVRGEGLSTSAHTWDASHLLVLPDDVFRWISLARADYSLVSANVWNERVASEFIPPGSQDVVYLGSAMWLQTGTNHEHRARLQIASVSNPTGYDDVEYHGWQWQAGIEYGIPRVNIIGYEAMPAATQRNVALDTYELTNTRAVDDAHLYALTFAAAPAGGGPGGPGDLLYPRQGGSRKPNEETARASGWYPNQGSSRYDY